MKKSSPSESSTAPSSRDESKQVSRCNPKCTFSPVVLTALWAKLMKLFSSITVEPVMLLDGLAYSIMIVFVENLQMDKICLVNLNLTEPVCANLSHYEEHSLELQQRFSIFGMYNGIIMAFLPLFFILFMGAWSDRYGRKVPLLLSSLGKLGWSIGYFINCLVNSWSVEYLLFAGLMDSIGGGTPSFLTAANAYISDVTSEQTRTSRVGLANSIWYLGGPIGTLIGTYIYKYGNYSAVFLTSFSLYLAGFIILCFLPESHGPFASKKVKYDESENNSVVSNDENGNATNKVVNTPNSDEPKVTVSQMFKDFFNYRRIMDSFKCTLKKRDGYVRAYILLLILCNMFRRLGRGQWVFLIHL